MSRKTEVKKVQAFPFPITLKIGTHVIPGQVVRMNHTGLMVETTSALLSVGDKPEMEFTLPVLKYAITCSGTVIKFYNQMVPGGMRIAEIHFRGVVEGLNEKISNYLTAAGVKP